MSRKLGRTPGHHFRLSDTLFKELQDDKPPEESWETYFTRLLKEKYDRR